MTPADGMPLAPVDLNQCADAIAGDVAAPSKPARTQRPRCGVCASRLPLTASLSLVCRCGGTFCAAHLHGGHECHFDYKRAARDRLREANPTISFAKL